MKPRTLRFALALVALIATLPFTTLAATYYVDGTAGADTNDGLALVTAWKTLEKAESIVVAGDTVMVNDGTYTPNSGSGYLQLSKNGTSGARITYQAINPGLVTINSTSTTRVLNVASNYRTFEGFIIDAQGAARGVVESSNRVGTIYRQMTFKNATTDGILCSGCVEISDSVGENNTLNDFRVDKSTGETSARLFDNLTFSSASTNGLLVKPDNATIENIHLSDFGNTTTAILLENSSNSTVRNSSFVGDGRAAIKITADAGLAASNNLIHDVYIDTGSQEGYGIAIGAEGAPTDTDNNIVRDVVILGEGESSTLHGILFGWSEGNILENSYISGTAYGLVDKGTTDSIVRNNIFNDTPGEDHSLYGKGSVDSLYLNNIVIKESGGGNAIFFAKVNGSSDSNDSATSSRNVLIRNNIVISGTNNDGIRAFETSQNFNPDYNLYDADGTVVSVGVTNYATLAAWQASSSMPDAHSLAGIPLFTNDSGNLSTSTDFMPDDFSPAIDAGTTVSGRTTDLLGNAIYGLPDLGPYEYQPPYEMGDDLIPLNTAIRVYGDEKFRYLASPSSGEADLAVELPGSTLTESLDITISSWETSGTYSKEWTETSSTSGLSDTEHVISDLRANASYNLMIDGVLGTTISGSDCVAGICEADSSGTIEFTYTGDYTSAVTFELIGEEVVDEEEEDDNDGNSRHSRRRTPTQTTEPTTPPTASSIPYSDFPPGTTSEAVRTLQLWLISHGYNIPAGATGYFGPQTQAALALFRAGSGTSQPIKVIFYRPLFLGSTGPDVIALQTILKSKGLYHYPTITGYYGQITLQAVADFQRSVGLDHLGYVGPATRAVLNSM